MAASHPAKITFVVPGQTESPDAGGMRGTSDVAATRVLDGFDRGRIKHSVRLRATRGEGPQVSLEAVPGTDVVVIEVAGGPELVLHPETARELLLAQKAAPVPRGSSAELSPDSIRVPFRLQWEGIDDGLPSSGTRSSFGDVLVSAFHVVTDVFKGPAANFAAQKIVDKVDAQVIEGMYQLDARTLPVLKETGARLGQLPPESLDGPALVLLHGTFSSTQGTFQKLWAKHPGHVDALFKYYGERVYALDHSTLGRSPIENALTLVEALRKGTRLHLVSHSRGGLVAEVLAKVCANPQAARRDFQQFTEAKYQDQREALRDLYALVAKNDINVERITRVACPVRGTLLASKRLDAYVSVLKWSLKLAGIPVAPAIVDFLGMVAQRRTDPAMMPGLAAQIPDSPLVRWLHAAGDGAGDLRVIAGDLAGDSVTSWLKTLLSNAFYWTDNDLVVQTSAMYGGASRARGATFLLDQGGEVSHFNYFTNDRSADAVVNALTKPIPPGFRVIGEESAAGESSTGVRGAPNVNVAHASASDLPAVILIPDVLSSHLKIGKQRVWLGRRTATEFNRLEYSGSAKTKVEPDGLLMPAYGALSRFLASSHEVTEFAYDWRLAIEDEAKRLAGVVDTALNARGSRKKAKQPVRIVAHGMGGLFARALQFVDAEVWGRLLAHADARLLLLGTPNGGSWTPMQVLSGDETFGGVLRGIGAPFQDHETRRILAGFPGLLQLQAGLTDPALQLDKKQTWESLAEADLTRVSAKSVWHNVDQQIDLYRWGIPTQAVLNRAVTFRRALDAQTERGFGEHVDKVITIVGAARSTPDGFENGNQAFVYRHLVEGGDGYITTQNARLAGVRAWSVSSDHQSLTTNPDAFEAYVELLKTGTTDGLSRMTVSGGTRASQLNPTYERTRPSRRPTAVRPNESAELLSAAQRDASWDVGVAGPALSVTVVNGNLKFIRQPLILGHYRSMALTGTEWVMDKLIGGTMNQLVWLRQYPDRPTSNKIFLNQAINSENPLQMPRPEAVIVVGLGEEGKLTTTDLTATVTHGVIAWAQRLVEHSAGAAAQFELAATLIGSGGAGITAGQAALAVAQGVREANLRLIDAGWPNVGHLYLIELYLDRATEAWRALQVQTTASAGLYRVTPTVRSGTGALRRPPESGYRGADYDFVSAITQRDARGDPQIAYRLDTKRARTEVHARAIQAPLLRELVVGGSNDRNTDEQIGRTLFQLLIPGEMEPFMGGTTSMVLEVDSGSAGIPWELLDSEAGTRDGADSRPWAIRTKLLRKLRTEEYRAGVADADAEAHVLVIGEPACDPKRYPRLPAAQAEARAVAQEFISGSGTRAGTDRVLPPDRVRTLIADDVGGADTRTIINAVHQRAWRIVHIAGHGEPPEKIGPEPVNAGDPAQTDGDPRGVVLSNKTFLGPREINAMRDVPELVFVNCCHLAARNVGQLLERYDRASFAAGVAESLIKIGVRCVIAAGWAVQDDAAMKFATTFYDHLLAGHRFIDAVAEARLASKALGGNTWAAYQCYGDPDWRFRWGTSDAQEPAVPGPAQNYGAELGGIASADALILALETIAIRSQYDKLDPNEQRRKIGYLEHEFADRWGEKGRVAEAFARALAEVGDRDSAVAWYQRAVEAGDGSASLSAAEQLGNLRARGALARVGNAQRRVEELERKRSTATKRELATLNRKLEAELAQARTDAEAAAAELEALARAPSTERLSLCGSAWKRRAMIEQIAADEAAETRAIAQMKQWYERAEKLARDRNDSALYYPALNRMAAELIVDAKKKSWTGFDAQALDAVRTNLDTQVRDAPDFWNVVGRTELRLYEALAGGTLATQRAAIQREYTDLRERVGALRYWDSVKVQLEFVLPKYAARASKAERSAAMHLLEHVRELAAEGSKSVKQS